MFENRAIKLLSEYPNPLNILYIDHHTPQIPTFLATHNLPNTAFIINGIRFVGVLAVSICELCSLLDSKFVLYIPETYSPYLKGLSTEVYIHHEKDGAYNYFLIHNFYITESQKVMA